MWLFGGRVAPLQKGRSDDGRQCGNAWSGYENWSQEIGSERKRKKEEVQGVLDYQEEQGFPKELHEGGCQEGVTTGYGASEVLGNPRRGDIASTERLKMRRQMAAAAARKKNTTSLSLFMEAFGFEVEEELSTMATQTWEEGAWTGKWHTEQKEAWLNQIREVQMWRQVRGPAGRVMCETRDLVSSGHNGSP